MANNRTEPNFTNIICNNEENKDRAIEAFNNDDRLTEFHFKLGPASTSSQTVPNIPNSFPTPVPSSSQLVPDTPEPVSTLAQSSSQLVQDVQTTQHIIPEISDASRGMETVHTDASVLPTGSVELDLDLLDSSEIPALIAEALRGTNVEEILERLAVLTGTGTHSGFRTLCAVDYFLTKYFRHRQDYNME
jgi:hypothetical protein